jgi:hypothetical protein
MNMCKSVRQPEVVAQNLSREETEDLIDLIECERECPGYYLPHRKTNKALVRKGCLSKPDRGALRHNVFLTQLGRDVGAILMQGKSK